MEILWVLVAVAMLGFVLLPVMRRRRGMIEQVPAGHPDAADPADYGFVREEELPMREEESSREQEVLDALVRLERRLDAIEARLDAE